MDGDSFELLVRDALARISKTDPAQENETKLLEVLSPVALSTVYQDVVIEGLLRKTELLLIGGSSKRFKSWAMLDLIYCISNGFSWLKFPTHQGIVIHFDLELHQATIRERLELIHSSYCRAGFKGSLEHLLVVPLRNKSFGRAHLSLISKQLGENVYCIVSIDPIYRFLLGKGENDPVAVCELLNEFLEIANKLGSAVALIQHFPKGDQSEKDAIDRFSGTGVWGRYPDSLVTFTAHEKDNCSSVNFIVRSFKEIDPFVVRWVFPRYQIEDSLDPAELKTKIHSRISKFSAEQLCDVLEPDQCISWTDWFRKCHKLFKISESSFRYKVNYAKQSKFVFLNSDNQYELSASYIQRNGH